MKLLRLLLIPVFLAANASAVHASSTLAEVQAKLQPKSNEDFALQNLRQIEAKQELQRLLDERESENRRRLPSADERFVPPGTGVEDIKLEADYILSAQYFDPGQPGHGAINNINFKGDPNGRLDWVVPRENALAILGLLQAYEKTGDAEYKKRAVLAADYLLRVQGADGGWYDQYAYETATTTTKSPTQTAEVMMALSKLGYTPARYQAMKKGAQFLMSLQNVKNKKGLNDGLIGGGKDNDTTYRTWRWASDNSFAFLALEDAAKWAVRAGEFAFALRTAHSAKRIIQGINESLYIDDPSDPDYGVWRRAIDENGVTQQAGYREWINYAPQMLDLPARGVGNPLVGEWIHKTLQINDPASEYFGAVVWDAGGPFTDRKSPGFSFQAILVWQDLGQTDYAAAAWNWAVNSGLQQKTPDGNGVAGSWIDWTTGTTTAGWWERFIDTSFYAISVMNGGYKFR